MVGVGEVGEPTWAQGGCRGRGSPPGPRVGVGGRGSQPRPRVRSSRAQAHSCTRWAACRPVHCRMTSSVPSPPHEMLVASPPVCPWQNSWLQLRRRAGPGLPLVSPIQGSTDHGISIDALLPMDTLATWIPLCESMAIQREKATGQEGHSTTPFIRTAPQTLEHLSFFNSVSFCFGFC